MACSRSGPRDDSASRGPAEAGGACSCQGDDASGGAADRVRGEDPLLALLASEPWVAMAYPALAAAAGGGREARRPRKSDGSLPVRGEARKDGRRETGGRPRPSRARASAGASTKGSDYGLASNDPDEPEEGLDWDYLLIDPDWYATPEAELPDCAASEGTEVDFARVGPTDALTSPLVSTSPPLAFSAVWGPDWDFGPPSGYEPSVDWWFVPVGYPTNSCNEFDPVEFDDVPGWVISGVRPFAAYSIVDTGRVDFEHATAETGDRIRVRIKYWVGGIHHFSFFVAIRGDEEVYDYRTFQTGTGVNYYDKWGWKALGWASLTQGTSFALHWQKEGGTPFSKSVRYGPCYGESYTIMVPDIELCEDYTGFSTDCVDSFETALEDQGYTTNQGLTEPGAWADPSAWFVEGHKLIGEPKHATSLLGNMVRGEVVFFVLERFADLPELARQGFELLFGPKVVLKQSLDLVAWSDAGTHTAERTWCIRAEDLQPWDTLEDEVIAQRAPNGNAKWIYQNRDIGTINNEVATLAHYDCEDLTMWLFITGGDIMKASEWLALTT